MALLDFVKHPATKAAGGVTATATAIALAVALIAPFEGYAKKPYVDWVGTGHPITWCYGQTKGDGYPVPPMNQTFTEAECRDMLDKSIAAKYEPYIAKCIHVALPPHRHAAILSFIYNLGPGALCNGPVGRYLNAGNVAAACNSMLAYDHAAGRRLAGLTRRRQAEATWCRRSD